MRASGVGVGVWRRARGAWARVGTFGQMASQRAHSRAHPRQSLARRRVAHRVSPRRRVQTNYTRAPDAFERREIATRERQRALSCGDRLQFENQSFEMKAPAVEAAVENISAQRALEHAIRTRLISGTRPGTSEYELDASEVLLKRDGKDIYKKSAARKNRYAMVFPGQLSALKEGRLGEMREMHTQEPVVYLDFPNGRLKLLGTIVRPKTTRYFTLNAKSKDRMNMEEWFDNVIVFSSWFWVGTKEANPEEKPLALPAELGDLSGEPEVDWESSVAAGVGTKTTTGAGTAAVATPTKAAKLADKADTNTKENGGRRPRRQAATVARKKMYADDSDADDVDEDSDEDDNGIASPVVVRGKVESFIPTVPAAPQNPTIPVRQSVTASARPSVAAASGQTGRSLASAPAAKRAKKEQPIVIDSDDSEDEDEDDIEQDSEDENAMELDDASEDDDDDDDDDSDSDFN